MVGKKIGKVKHGKSIPRLKEIDKNIIKILKENPEGLRQRSIAKTLNLKERTAYNHLLKLKKLKILKNLYPIWKIWRGSDPPRILAELLESDKNSQGHNIAWVLPLINKPNWWNKRKDRLMKLKEWHFKSEVIANNNVYHQISNDYMQIQTYKNSIYFICNKYNTSSDLETYLKSKYDVLEAIRYLEEQFRFKFISEGNFHLICLTPHYVTLNEALAEHFRKDGDRFIMKTKEGYELRVDFSEPFGIESDNLEVKRRYLRVVKNYQDNPLLPLPSELYKNQEETSKNLNILVGIVSKQAGMYADFPKQIQSHLKLIQEYRKENIAWRKKKVKEIRKDLKYGVQTKLGDFF